jgi:hypothetical protein
MKKIILFNLVLTATLHPASYARETCNSIFEIAQSTSSLSKEQRELKMYFETKYEKDVNWEWNFDMPKELNALKEDASEGQEKIEILQKLGFQISGTEVKSPRYIDFVNNYLKQLSELGIPRNESLLPALVLWRVNEGKIEHRLVTPGIDPWPAEPGFMMSAPPVFNLPYDLILKAHQNGKFPLVSSGVHDIFHFVSFLRNPEYMRTLRLATKGITNPRPVKFMGFRLNYLDEWFSLGNPKLKDKMKAEFSLLKTIPVESANSFKSFLDAANSMPDEKLITYAHQLEKIYPSLLTEYGGAVTRSGEKKSFSDLSGGIHFFDMFLNPQPMRDLNRIWRESPSLFPKTLQEILEVVELSEPEFAKYLTHEIASTYRNKFSQLYRNGQDLDAYVPSGEFLTPATNARAIIMQMLRTHIARMEYVIWRSTEDMTYKDIIKGILRPDGSVDKKVLEFVKEGWGENSFLYRVLSFGLSVN